MTASLRPKLRTLLLSIGLAVTAGCGDAATASSETGGVTSSSSGGSTDAPGVTTGASEPGSTGVPTTSGSDDSGDEPGTTGETGGTTGTSGVTGDAGTTGGSSEGESSEGGSSESGGSESGGEPDPVIPGPKVKFMSFNIRVGTANDGEDHWDKRKGLVYQVFKDQDADFIGVQEALTFQLKAIDANVSGYERIGVSTIDGMGKGPVNAIYYRKSRFEKKKSETFWLSNTPDVPGSQTWGNKFPRAVTWGRFAEKDTGYTLYVYNTHFDHVSQNSREKSAVLLAKRIADRGSPNDPFVAMGDLNAAEGNLVVRFLKGDAKIDANVNEVPMRDTFRVAHPDANNVGTAHGFNGGTGGNKIDYIFVPPKQKVNGAAILHFNVNGRYPSDHFPITGTVTFADQ